jgi:MATE family multidrug resistance protein
MQASPMRIDLDGSPYKTILKLAIPTVIAMMSQAIVNAVDSVFFAHLPSAQDANDAQAALMPSLILLWMFGGGLSAVSVGAQALGARRFVEGKYEAAGAVLGNAIMFCVIAGVVLTGVAIAVLPWLAEHQHPNESVQRVITSYGTWRMYGVMSMAMTMAIKGFFDGLGRTWIHFVSSVVMNIANILFCYIFIFGKFGAPAMGAEGAGLAALLATWIGLFVMLVFVWRERKTYRPMRLANFSWKLTMDILKLSVPAAVATVVMMFGFQLFLKIVAELDAVGGSSGSIVDAHGLTTSVNAAATSNIISMLKLTFTACIAFGTATATLVSQSLGAKRPELASRFGWASIKLGLIIFGVVGVAEGILFTPQICELWTLDPVVQHAMLIPMRMIGCATPLIAIVMIMTEALFGAGTPRFVAIVQFLMVFLVLLPAAYVMAVTLGWGLVGIWAAATVYISLGALIMSIKFARGGWKQIAL